MQKDSPTSKPSSLIGRQPSHMRNRTFILFTICTVFALVIVARLFYLQIIRHDDYKKLVLDQMLYETEISAKRGTIKDRNGVILATNYTTERIFIDPHVMEDDKERVLVATGLSELLDVDYDFVYTEAGKTKYRDRTIKKNVEKETADKVRAFIDEHDLSSIHMAETTTRVYPFGSLASHVIGFCGADGGLYGLEYQYNRALSGTSGKIFSAMNGWGDAMPYNYETFIDAKNGANLITTIDYKVQSFLENHLEQAAIESGCQSRACGIVMNPKTGEILAMATYPPYDLNAPRTLPDYYDTRLDSFAAIHGEDSKEYQQYMSDILFSSWNNKCLTDTYEPGSTSKIFTTAMALEENVSTVDETFTCTGSIMVKGWSKPIRCHKKSGHGVLNFAEALQQSCNPVMIQLSERIGIHTFCNYFSAFGLDERTGIDLPGEATSIYLPESKMSGVDLAVYSFGQRYNVTAIQQLTAVSAVANNGTMVTPHLVKEIVDDDGNVLATFGTTEVRQVVSRETANTISDILEGGVSGNGGARNAAVKGYKVAAKTGTSEKGTGGKRIASTVAYAPSDDAEVSCIIIVDEPTRGSLYGSTVAAPYVSKTLADVLPYLGIEPDNKEETDETVVVPNFRGLSLDEAILHLMQDGISYQVVGSGISVVDQTPPAGSTVLKKGSKITLYTEAITEKDENKVPNVQNMTPEQANKAITDAGFLFEPQGTTGNAVIAVSQSPAAGEILKKGSVVTVEFRYQGTD